jgi:RimJ/RimL family protein N-acetyltransferase
MTAPTPLYLISLSVASQTEVQEFKNIVANPILMASVGRGEPWSAEYVDNLVKQCQEDDLLTDDRRTYYHWLGVVDGVVVGYIGLHPYTRGLQIRVISNVPRRGYATAMIKELLHIYQGGMDIYALVAPSNIASLALFRNLGWFSSGTVKFAGLALVSFRAPHVI